MTWLPRWHQPTFSYLYSTIQIKNLRICEASFDYERMNRVARMALMSTARNRRLEIMSCKVLINDYFSRGDEREAFQLLNHLATLDPADQEVHWLLSAFGLPEQPEQDSPDGKHVLPRGYHTT